ncbi:MAG: ATP-binding protein [Bacteroidota bacterium]
MKTLDIVFAVGVCLLCIGFFPTASAQTPMDSLAEQLQQETSDREKLALYHQLLSELSTSPDTLQYQNYRAQARSLAQTIEDTEALGRTDVIHIARFFRQAEYDSVLHWANTVIQYLPALEFSQVQGEVYYYQANTKLRMGQSEASALDFFKAQHYFEISQDTSWQIRALANLGGQLSLIGQYEKALEVLYQSERYALVKGSLFAQGAIAVNIGIAYDAQELHGKAVESYMRGIEAFSQLNDSASLARTYSNVGASYMDLGTPEKALEPFHTARKFLNSTSTTELRTVINSAFANYFIEVEQYDSAFILLNEALALNSPDPSTLYFTLTKALLASGEVEKAKEMYPQATQYVEKSGRLPLMLSLIQVGIAIAEGEGDFSTAYRYSEEARQLEDSLNSVEQSRKVAFLVSDYQNRQELDSLTRAKQELEVNYARESFRGRLLIIGLLVVGAASGWVYRAYIKKKQAYAEMTKLNRQVNEYTEELLSQKEHLNELLVTKDRFFSIISHDLRGPIHSFTSLAFLLKDLLNRGKMDELPPLVNALDTNSRHVAQLLDNLLNWAMQQQGLMTLSPEEISLSNQMKDIQGIFMYQTKNKEIELETEVPDDLTVFADPQTIFTVLRNLMSNAIKFTKRRGTISICAREDGEMVCLQVKDTGVGMSQAQIESVFSVDGRKVGQGTEGEKGTGLGLPLVREFVLANKGSIAVESEMGSGTTFKITLPRKAQSVAVH